MDKSNVEVTAEQIKELLATGMSKTQIGEKFGITAQKVGMILKDADMKALTDEANETDKGDETDGGADLTPDVTPTHKTVAKVEMVKDIPASVFAKEFSDNIGQITQHKNITILTASEYEEYSKANGRVMGRPKGVKTVCTIEELRALINSGWTPSMIMGKHGLDGEEFKQLVWRLSKAELRDKPLKFDLSRDFIQR